ncbi:MAG: hypothetical protein ISS78_05470 [Phycisphaerae bacterium]|nr:hypothetical protein [Phycisphaerae bacterium]
MKKKFDCIAMKRASQEKIYAQTKDMSRQEEIAFFRKGGDQFERQIEAEKKKLAEGGG